MEQTQTLPSSDLVRIAPKELRAFVDRVIQRVGCNSEQAATVAEILVEADLRGVHSHGVNRLEMYVSELEAGEVNPKTSPEIIKETDSIACVDGKNGVGMVVAKFCMELAITKAKKHGIGWVVARGANHYGIAGYYAMMASKQGMIGMSFTNTSPIVFPTRSSKIALGTNPIAVAAPSTNPEDPLVLDMATSAVALGKIEYKDRQGKTCPHGWGADSTGRETTDPKVVLNGGGCLPLGGVEETSGYKGYGLAMMVELFCGMLSGSDWGPNIPPWRAGRKRPANLGQCFVCIDPQAFGGGFDERVSALMQTVRTLPHIEEDKPVLAPGDPEKAIEKEYTENGIALHKNLVDALQKIAKDRSVDLLITI